MINSMNYKCRTVGYIDTYHNKVKVTSNLIKAIEESVNINISPLIYEVMDDIDCEYNVLVYHDFISVYTKSNTSSYRCGELILGFNTEKVMYNIYTPILVLSKIIEFLEDADTKVGGIHIADYIADVGILY